MKDELASRTVAIQWPLGIWKGNSPYEKNSMLEYFRSAGAVPEEATCDANITHHKDGWGKISGQSRAL